MPNRVFLYILQGGFRIAKAFDGRKAAYNIQDVSSILLLNTTAIGDTLFCTPAIRAVRKTFPEAKIISLVSPKAREVLLNNPNIDRFIDYTGRVNLPFFFRLPGIIKGLRKERVDLSIVLDSNDPEAGPFSYLSGAPVRIGWQESRLSFLFNLPARKKINDLHIVDIKLKALETVGVKAVGRKPEIFLSEEEETKADRILRDEGLSKEGVVGIHPFGAKRYKWWPEEYVISLGNLLLEKYGYRAVIFGGGKERDSAEKISKGMKERPLVLAGRTGIRESAALIKQCIFFVTSDSGPMHLAQAVGIPTIAIFGPTDPSSAGPTGEKNIVLRKKVDCSPCKVYDCPHVSCMKAIGVEDVLGAVEEMRRRGWVH
ncbi:MAG: glycosyltransferase family 9 protein [Nitrospirota bacterium]